MTPFDCPRCAVTLTMSDRQGIEIDYCPQCRGVWLDRGELDKILERAGTTTQPGSPAGGWGQAAPAPSWSPETPPPSAPPPSYAAPPPGAWQPRRDDDHDRRHHDRGYREKRKHWLSELFD